MAQFRTMILTDRGRDLVAKIVAGSTGVAFTKVALSAQSYEDNSIPALTALGSVKQTVKVSRVTKLNTAAVKIEAAVDNLNVTQSYTLAAIGLYAKDPDLGEILYGVSGAEVAGFVPAYNGVTVSGIYINLTTSVSNADHVNLEVDPAATATIGDIQRLNDRTEPLTYNGASLANSLIVEKNLGTSFTEKQSQDIRSGKFNLVRTGGYWMINGRKYWAAHADYRLHCGQKEVTQHHMLVVPDAPLYSAKMNQTDTADGGYYGSAMKTGGLAEALRIIEADFGAEHILPYSAILSNAVSGGMISGWAWYDNQKIDLMSEHMVCGSYAWGGGSQNGYDIGADKSQLALFQARHDLINCRSGWYWLRDIGGSNYFCTVNEGGNANTNYASHSGGVRPAFLLY